MLDLGMVMYAGLLLLTIWRKLLGYRCCGLWLSFLNFASLLYVLLVVSLVYALISFYKVAQLPLDTSEHAEADLWSVTWLRSFVLGAPAATIVTLVLTWFQTEGHIFEIHKDAGSEKHDRAVQIIALPGVFAVMAMASMVPILEFVTGNISPEMLKSPFGFDIQRVIGLEPMAATMSTNTTHLTPENIAQQWEETKRLALWRYETCFFVADLFEAWALYQFGTLALQLIGESLTKLRSSEEERPELEGPEDHLATCYAAAERDLLASHAAVTSLTWLGTSVFIAVCMAQTACSLWPYVGGDVRTQDSIMKQFQVAGFVASGAAIYNIWVVERAFHHHLESCSPLLKFLSVKILVSLSFFQRGVLITLQTADRLLPSVLRKIVTYVPLVGDIVNLTDVQVHLFYPALILFECLLAAVMHMWAWKANESWYLDDATRAEKQPLLDHA